MYEISEVQIMPIKLKDGLVGFASLVFNKSLYLSGLGIYTRISGEGGYRITYPIRKGPRGEPINVYHPLNKDVGQAIEKAITEKYEEMILNLYRDE